VAVGPGPAGRPSADLAGLIVIDKPEGPTSHDVVARVRRVLGEKRVGHAGTLDPLASGVIVVLVGQATRLSSYLTSDDKRYRAAVRLGFATTTYDRQGEPQASPAPVPADVEPRLRATLDAWLGTHRQTPPAYSAKKIDGERAHRLARRGNAAAPAPVPVTLKAWTLIALDGDVATIDLHTSAGFYVRSLAHDVGAALGCGGHLVALRRTGSGAFTLEGAVPLPPPDAAAASLTPALRSLDTLLPDWPEAVVTAAGAERVVHGARIGPDACTVWPDAVSPNAASPAPAAGRGDQPLHQQPTVRLVDEAGRLLALAVWRDGFLHPSVVLG
jgi:tRNA pseudouridine55 synthase